VRGKLWQRVAHGIAIIQAGSGALVAVPVEDAEASFALADPC
jgi:hypothetical protein